MLADYDTSDVARAPWVGFQHACTSSRCLCVCSVPGRSHGWTGPCVSPSGPPSISPSEVGWAFWIAESQSCELLRRRCGQNRRGVCLRVALTVVRPALRVHPPQIRHSSGEPCREATAWCASGTLQCCPGQPCACTSGIGLRPGTAPGQGPDTRCLRVATAHENVH